MRNFKRFATSLVALGLLVALSSCEKQPVADAQQEVSFNIDNVTDMLKKDVVTPDNPTEFPDCVEDAVAAFVKVDIDGTVHTLKVLQGLNDGTETEVMKMAPGTYSINSFNVYDADENMIWSSPTIGSYYQKLWNLDGVTGKDGTKTFKVTAFEKHKVNIDVLCWEPYFYEEFGFTWFDFQTVTIKTLCFFGDICTPNYEDWGQSQYDFIAEIRIWIRYDGKVLNMASTDDEGYNGGPLCIEYPDFGDLENEEYKVNINIKDENGEWLYIGHRYLNADSPTSEFYGLDTNGDKDMDGIFDFVVYEGDNCNYTGNAGVNWITEMDSPE